MQSSISILETRRNLRKAAHKLECRLYWDESWGFEPMRPWWQGIHLTMTWYTFTVTTFTPLLTDSCTERNRLPRKEVTPSSNDYCRGTRKCRGNFCSTKRHSAINIVKYNMKSIVVSVVNGSCKINSHTLIQRTVVKFYGLIDNTFSAP